jgi:rhodanese-related sulfurtransferase
MRKTIIGLGLAILLTLSFNFSAFGEDWMAKGEEAFKKADFKAAAEAFQNAIKADPADRKAWRAYDDAVVYQRADVLLTMSDTLPIWIFKAEGDLIKEIREKKDVFLIDVRRAKELQEFRLAGATPIDLKDLAKSQDKLPKNKTQYIVTICKTGARASYAATVLRMMGYTNVWAMIDAKMPPAGGIPSLTLIFGNAAAPK